MLDNIKNTLWAATEKLHAGLDAREYKHLAPIPSEAKTIALLQA